MTNTIKKLLGFALAAGVLFFLLANLHHVLMFALIVGAGVTAFVLLTNGKSAGGHTRKRVARFVKMHFTK